ncbi:MAG: hypothetical protein HRF50_17575 [Phycisphaerae bacterium]|jgi:hypothetical protein
MSSLIEGDIHFSGNVTFGAGVTLPNGAVTAGKVAAGAAIEATKLQQRNRAPWRQGNSDADAADGTQVIYTVTGATGTLREFKAGCVTPCTTGASITVDLRKNGASVLSAVITLDQTQSARQLVSAAISTMAVAAGDVLEVVIDATPGTGTIGKGVFGYLTLDELPQ